VTTENGAAPTGGTPAPAAGRRGDGWSGENRDHGGTKSGGHVATGGDRDEETKKALEALQKSQLEGNQFDDQRGRGPTTSTPTTRQQPVTPPVARPPAATATAATPPPRPDPRDPLSNTVDGTLPRPSASAAPGFHARLAQARTGSVRFGALVMQGGMADGEAQRVLRSHTPALRTCYDNALQRNASVRGHMDVQVTVDPLGEVKVANITQSSTNDTQLDTCVTQQMKRWRFPAPGTQDARFTTGLDFVPDQGATNGTEEVAQTQPSTPAQQPAQALPYTGRFKIVMEHLAQGAKDAALDEANRWHGEQPGDIMALVALGEALEARGDIRTAARAYGSILELFSFRADSRRFAGERLERLKDPAALKLAIDSYTKAAEQRPDHPASHRLVAFTLLKAGEHEKAFEALKKGAQRRYPEGRFRGVDRILKEDLGLIAAAWSHAQPARTAEIRGKLRDAGGVEENGASLRFVLNWETDANDVDFHIYDSRGGHAFYSQMQLPSGGELYADVTTGYGPECFTIRGEAGRRAYPYKLQAHYYSRGPMGYGMGKLEIIDHDGKGNLTFDERPFVVMVDQAYVDLGGVDRSKGTVTASLK
jgi:TonB family protein